MSAIQSLIRVLASRVGARWINTGGGCMAVEVQAGRKVADGVWQFEILITGREDVFGRSDEMSDDDVSGFFAGLYVYGSDGQRIGPDEPITVYRTRDDAGECLSAAYGDEDVRVVDLLSEVSACAAAVESAVEMVLRAERDGRE